MWVSVGVGVCVTQSFVHSRMTSQEQLPNNEVRRPGVVLAWSPPNCSLSMVARFFKGVGGLFISYLSEVANFSIKYL